MSFKNCVFGVIGSALWSLNMYGQQTPVKNVVVILADDHARKVTGCYGNPVIRTPNIDRLASEGMLFDRAYCNAPISSASRASLLTGKYPHSTALNLLFTPFDDEVNVTIAEVLRDLGYQTALFGKTHFNNHIWGEIYNTPLPGHGFNLLVENGQYNAYISEKGKKAVPANLETYVASRDNTPAQRMNHRCLPVNAYDDDASGTFFAREVSQFIKAHKKKPFFVWYAPFEPHQPYAFPVEYAGKYLPGQMVLPEGSVEDDRWIPAQYRDMTDEQRKGIIAAYYTSVEYMDKNVGIVLDAIKESGLEDNTLVIYISDNGYLLHEHKRFEKHTLWEEATRQPLIVKGKGIPKGKRSDEPVEYVDIVPTILDFLCVPPLPSAQGISFKNTLLASSTHKKAVFSFYLEDNSAMVCNKDWKYIFHTGARDLGIGYYTGEGPAGITHFLYDLKKDPNEHKNLAYTPEFRVVFEQMRDELIAHFKKYHPEASRLPGNLKKDGELVWFCEPRDRGALPSLEDKPIRIFYNPQNTTSVRIISESNFEDKMKAAWIGQMAGVGWAAVTEFKWIGDIIPEDRIPQWKNEMVNQHGQDDMYVEVNFMASMEDNNTDVSIRRAGINFANSTFGLAAANDHARENLRSGIAPPASGHPQFNFNCEDIDYQIESDYAGIIAPGMPQVPVDLGKKFGSLMNYGDGIYAGQFIGGMYSAAYFENDIRTIIDYGLACIPDSSLYAVCIRDVISWYEADTVNWLDTWEKIVNKYYRTLENQPYHRVTPKAWAGIDAKLNGAFIVLGLLYGRGDIDSTFYISARCGFDSDCNPSNALGVLFTTMGLSKIPKKFYSALDENRQFSGSDYTFPKLVAVSKQLTEAFLLKQGGKIEKRSDGQNYYVIPVRQPVLSSLEKSWETQALDEENIRFGKTEMDEILFLPSASFRDILQQFAPGWLISNSTTKAKPELINYNNRDKVLQMAFLGNSNCNIRSEQMVPDIKNPKFTVKISNDPGKTWRMRLLFNWQQVYAVEVNDELTSNGWHEVNFDLSEYRGKKLFILIQGGKGSGEDSKVYLNDLVIK